MLHVLHTDMEMRLPCKKVKRKINGCSWARHQRLDMEGDSGKAGKNEVFR